MAQSLIVYSEVIPTILAMVGIILLAKGILEDNNPYTAMGLVLFLAAVIVPFVLLNMLL